MKLRRYTVRLEQCQWEALEAEARSCGLGTADLFRTAVKFFLTARGMNDVSRQRLARINEFQHRKRGRGPTLRT